MINFYFFSPLNRKRFFCGFFFCALFLGSLQAQTLQVCSLVGDYTRQGNLDGTSSAAKLGNPFDLISDSKGNFYVADELYHNIRKVTAAGVVTTIAGSGTAGFAEGIGTAAQFNAPTGLALDEAAGILYVADFKNNRIRKIDLATRTVTTYAGTGVFGGADGSIATATFAGPFSVALDAAKNLYVNNNNQRTIRKITPDGIVSTIAGSGDFAVVDGIGTAAGFWNPTKILADSLGNLYIADVGSIRKMVLATNAVTTLAGNGKSGFADGTGAAARFDSPRSLALDSLGNMYVTDNQNNRIRKLVLATGVVTTIAGADYNRLDGNPTDGPTTTAKLALPGGITINPSGIIYFTDVRAYSIRRIAQAVTANISYAGSPYCRSLTTGAVTFSGTAGGTYSASPTGLSINATTGEINPSNSTVGTYTITYFIPASATVNACPINPTATVTINALPAVGITGANTICIGSTTSLSPTTGGTWVGNGNTIATVTNAGVVTGVANGTATFSFTQTSTGCTSTTAAILVNPMPTATATNSSQNLCSGSSIQTMILSGTVANTVYNWTRDKTTEVTGIAASGTGNISGTLTNTTNAPVVVKFTITPSFTNFGTTCTGAPITATVTVEGVATATSSLTWTGAVSTDWSNACNWSPNGVPTATNQIIITNVTNKPTVGSSLTAVAKEIILRVGSTLTNNGTLIVGGVTDSTGSTITNNICGKILVRSGNYVNAGTTANAGYIEIANNLDNTGGTFTNMGALKYGNLISTITSNQPSSVIVRNLIYPQFIYGGTFNGTVNGIFTDSLATVSAGTFTAPLTFTPLATLPRGVQTLYVKITPSGGACAYVVPFSYNTLTTAVSKIEEQTVVLNQNRPNPFSQETLISFVLPESGKATLTIFDINGRQIFVSYQVFNSGSNEMILDKSVFKSSGIYIYRLTSDKYTVSERLQFIAEE